MTGTAGMGAMLPSSTDIRNQASAPKAGDHSTDFLSIFEERGSNIVYEGEPFRIWGYFRSACHRRGI